MQYLSVEEAKALPGLRLVLTRGVPGPWGEAAKAVLRARHVDFVAAEQLAGEDNTALAQWTGVRNAPVAIYNDEAPRTGYLDILMLAERLGSGVSLLPADPQQRFMALGIASEICGHNGFGWAVRLLLFQQLYSDPPIDPGLPAAQQQLCADYGFTKGAVVGAADRACQILGNLDCLLKDNPSGYLVGERLTAADLYWATFSMIISPLPHRDNPMPDQLRGLYDCQSAQILNAFTPALKAHRDRIYTNHIGLPLDF
ncbi:MAG: hypothetical protein AAF221_14990 [Pseudomonadota bacterium]